MRTYEGHRDTEGRAYVRVRDGEDAPWSLLPPRYDLFNHSPDGFEWGYGGSGPAQLALALCADAIRDDKIAVRMHQDFKVAIVAELARGEPWTLTIEQVLRVCALLGHARLATQKAGTLAVQHTRSDRHVPAVDRDGATR